MRNNNELDSDFYISFFNGIVYATSNFAYASINNNNDEKVKALKYMMIYIAGIILNIIIAKL